MTAQTICVVSDGRIHHVRYKKTRSTIKMLRAMWIMGEVNDSSSPQVNDLGKGRKNDVYLYDAKTYIQRKVELKSLSGYTAETIKKQLISGSGQAGIIAYDIQSNIKKMWLIEGLREGWSDELKVILLNYKGQWYQLDKKNVFEDSIYELIK